MPPRASIRTAIPRLARAEDGERVVPANRFTLRHGSPRATISSIAPSSRASSVLIGTNGSPLRLREALHPTMRSIEFPGRTRRIKRGPLASADGALILRDRRDNKVRWIKPAFEIKPPADSPSPVFVARTAGLAEDGSDLWIAEIAFKFHRVRPPAVQRRIDRMQSRDADLKFEDIPSSVEEATLALPYGGADGPLQQIEIIGHVDSDAEKATFTLSGDAIGLAWRLLRETTDATIELTWHYTVYSVEDEEPETLQSSAPLPRVRVERIDQPVVVARGLAEHRLRLSGRVQNSSRNVSAATALRARIADSDPAFRKFSSKALMRPASGSTAAYSKKRVLAAVMQNLDLTDSEHAGLFAAADPVSGQLRPIHVPPWGGQGTPTSTLAELDPYKLGLDGDLASRWRFFASLLDPGQFIVIPSAYVLAREPDTGNLEFNAKTVSDIMQPENSMVVVYCGLEPDFSPAQELELRAALERYAARWPAQDGALPRIRMSFPTDFGRPELTWMDPLSQASEPIIDGRTVLLSVTAKNLGFAQALFNSLSRKGYELKGDLTFRIPDDHTIRVPISVGLAMVTGPSVKAQAADEILSLTEIAGLRQSVSGLVRSAGFGTVENYDLATSLILEPRGEQSSECEQLADGEWSVRAVQHYPDIAVIDPEQIRVEEVVTAVIVTTRLTAQSKLGDHRLESLQITIEIASLDPIVFVMRGEPETGHILPQIVRFMLPLQTALKPEARVLHYQIIAMLEGSKRISSAQISHDFGVNPDIEIDAALFC